MEKVEKEVEKVAEKDEEGLTSIERVAKNRAVQLLNRQPFRQHRPGVGIPHGDDLIPVP